MSLRTPLRAGIVLLGLQLSFAQVAAVGVRGLVILLAAVAGTYWFTVAAGRALGVDSKLARLLGVGTGICGASAIIAANAVVRDKEGGVPYALGVITLYGTITMLLLPLLARLLGMEALDYGLWAGASVHELAQVVAAGFAYGPEAGQFATVSKLTRVLMLVPLVMLLAWTEHRPAGEAREAATRFPWFVLGFVAMVGVASTGWLPASWLLVAKYAAQGLMALALAAVGLETAIGAIMLRGWRALLLGGLATLFIVGLSLALVLVLPGG